MARSPKLKNAVARPKASIQGTFRKAPSVMIKVTAASVAAHALDTFGSAAKAEHWMNRPNPLLHGNTPRQVIESDPSTVEAELVRIDHGVYV